jgi:uncharacterized membrane protein YesL
MGVVMSDDKNELVNVPQARAGLIAALNVLARAGGELRYNGLTLGFYNLVWFVASLPVITLPPATAALYAVTREISYRRSVTVGEFWGAMRTYWWVSWRWALLNAVAAGIIFANLTFYRYLENVCGLPLLVLWIGITLVWIVVQLYCFPTLLEQIQPSLRTALRNAPVLALHYPVFTLTVVSVTGLLAFISVIAPFLWALITTALLAFLHNRAVYYLIQVEQGHDPYMTIVSSDSLS